MYKVMLFLHIVGTLGLGFYLVLPFVLGSVSKLSLAAQEGTVSAVKTLNRYAQIALVIQLLTGGYMISKGDYSVAWMVVVVILFLAIGAFSGILAKPLRLALEAIRQNNKITAQASKLTTLSAALSICVLLIAFFMVYHSII